MRRQSRSKFMQKFLPWIHARTNSTAARGKARDVLNCRLRVEPLEDRRMLSVTLADQPAVELVAPTSPPNWEGTVIHDSKGILWAVDVNVGGVSPRRLGEMGWIMSDMAFDPAQDLYGVDSWWNWWGTSCLYTVTVDQFADLNPTITTSWQHEILADDDSPVDLNALEFDAQGMLYAAGYHLFSNQDWVFKIELDPGSALRYVAQRVQPLYVDTSEYPDQYFQSAGDLEFDCYHRIYVTTRAGELLRLYPASQGYPNIEVVGDTGHGDFFGLTYVPSPPRMLGFGPKNVNYQDDVYRIDLSDARVFYYAVLDQPRDVIRGAATVFNYVLPTAPAIGYLSDTPDPVVAPGSIELRAHDVDDLDGWVAEVSFYRESNGTAGLQTGPSGDTLVGSDNSESGGWTVQVPTAGLAPGTYTYYAQATDNYRETSPDGTSAPSTTNTVQPAKDFGDAPDPTYPTLLAHNGARHVIVPGFYLGSGADEEHDGQPTAGADGDDNDSAGDDEDGVVFPPLPLIPGFSVELTVTASALGKLDAWIDFNGNGSWGDAGDQIFTGQNLAIGDNQLFFSVPSDAALGRTFARFRFSSSGGLSYVGSADDGEVEDYRVEIANVIHEGQTVNVFGRDDFDDVFEFTGDEYDYTIVINGDVHQFPADEVDNVVFHAGEGYDTAIFNGSQSDETARLWPGQGEFSGDGFLVTASGVESINAKTEAGDDTVYLFDSDQSDTLRAWPHSATMSGPGFSHEASGFEVLLAYAKAGDGDTAFLYDSAGDDTFIAQQQWSKLYGDGFYNRAKFFDVVHAYAQHGGIDTAFLYDSADDDTLIGTPTYAKLYGEEFFIRAKFFEYVHAYAQHGGTDTAFLYDSPGGDTLIATPTYAKLYGEEFFIRAKSFDYVHAYAGNGGHDTAYLNGSGDNDTFIGTRLYSKLYGPGFSVRAKYFAEVYAQAGSGDDDQAFLYDSAQIDLLEAARNWARLSNADLGFLYEVTAFDYVRATSSAAGDEKDVAPILGFVLEPVPEGFWEDL